MASSRSLSSVNFAATSLSTPVKPANPAPSANPAPAPSPSAPAPSVTQLPPSSEPPRQPTSTTQAIKSNPTASPPSNKNQSSTQNARETSKPSVVSPDRVATPALPSPSSSSTGSRAAPVWGAIFAVFAVILALLASLFLLRRRRQKSRRLWEAKRMPAANFGKYEGEIIPERKGSIEATLAADLARLRSLDPEASMINHHYDREFPKRSLDYSPNSASPGEFKIARKPSLRVRDTVVVVNSSNAGNADIADLNAYDAKEYIGDFSSRESIISSLPPNNLSPHRNPQFH